MPRQDMGVAVPAQRTASRARDAAVAAHVYGSEDLFEAAPCALVVVDLDGVVLRWNPAAEQLFGWSAAEVVGRPSPAVPARDARRRAKRLAALVAGEQLPIQQLRRRRKDGGVVDVEIHSAVLRDADGAVTGLLAAYVDVAASMALRAGLDDRLHQQAALAALGQAALRSTGLDEVLAEAAQTIAQTLALPLVTITRRTPDDGVAFAVTLGWTPRPGQTGPPEDTPAVQVIRTGVPVHIPDVDQAAPSFRQAVRAGGGRSSLVVPVGDPGRPWGAISAHSAEPAAFTEDDQHFLVSVGHVIAAAAARYDAQAQLQYRAGHDVLTGLPNRDRLQQQLGEALVAGHRTGTLTALLLIDLDGFKDVNDAQGHQAGDGVLRQVAARLQARAGHRDHVARLGGDEFAVVLTGLRRPGQARAVAAELVGVLRDPFASPGGPVLLGGSIGVALAPDHADDPQTLLQRADLAMYRAKRERTGLAVFDAAVEDDAGSRLQLVSDLRAAITTEQVTLAYQPVVHLRDGAVRSVEALARWNHPERGPQSPAHFVALAEASGLDGDLTDLVLRTAARQGALWRDGGLDLTVAVNLPPSLLCSVDFADYLQRAVQAQRLPLDRLCVEVTEGTLGSDATIPVLERIRGLGVAIAVDDFGTGYSSLGRLKHLPVGTLKIDRSFVATIQDDPRDVAIVRAVVALADTLGMDTVAEGVETLQTAELLSDLGVHRAQGYLFARPLPAAELVGWHAAWTAGDHPWLRRQRPA